VEIAGHDDDGFAEGVEGVNERIALGQGADEAVLFDGFTPT